MITLSDVRKVYRTRNGEVTALDGINLHIPQGQIHGIVGESGAGKSTLIRCLTALETPPVERFRSTVKISPRSTSANASKLAVISAWFSSM